LQAGGVEFPEDAIVDVSIPSEDFGVTVGADGGDF
jgi:hypothetical protein